MRSINPFNNQLIKEYQEQSLEEAHEIIDKTNETWKNWRTTPYEQRSQLMFRLAKVLIENKYDYAHIITNEMGKPLAESLAEVEKSAWVCNYYAEQAEQMLDDEILESDASQSFVSFEPMGLVLAVMPWNFPFWQVFRFAAPALMAGNAAILKHASNVMGCGIAIEEAFIKAGFPKHLFSNLIIGSAKVKAIIENKHIKATTLTGSEYAGSKVASASGRELKKAVLELGGSDAFIVLEDADLAAAAKWGVFSRMLNNGQSCIAAKRFILHEDIADEYIGLIIKELDNWKIGNPLAEEVKVGPLARPDLLSDLQIQIEDALEKGASLIKGGKAMEGAGNFFEATIISDLTPQMSIYSEETFGPVFAIYKVADAEEAIQLANDSEFGLGASLWTEDVKKGVKLATRVDSGAVFINGMTKSDPRLPFGGIKKSGFGRELSHYGIKEFVNIKTIWVK